MSRPALEVADIFRDHGAAWRRANAGHVSLDQMKVMSAIERCRTAALGGHVARCEELRPHGHRLQQLPQPALPQVPGRGGAGSGSPSARPSCCRSPYFHVVLHAAGPIADIAYQNKAVVYDLLFKASAETDAHDRGRSQAPRRPHRHHLRAAHLGLGADASSRTCT